MTELKVRGADDNIRITDDGKDVIIRIRKGVDYGRTKGGEGANLNCGCTYGYKPVSGLDGHKLSLHLIRKP